MKVMRQMTAGILTGVLMVTTAALPMQAKGAVYTQNGAAEVISSNQAEDSGQEPGTPDLQGIRDGDGAFTDGNTDDGTGELSDISEMNEGKSPDAAVAGGDANEEEILKDGEMNPDMADGSGIDLLDQAKLDRALAEGWVEFKPNDENPNEVELQAGIAGGDLVTVASREVGISGCPNKYTYWLGTISGTYAYAWCHAFVSWCGAQAGAAGQIPKTASCFYGAQEFKARGQWQNRISGYVPKSGDIIYFDWNADGGYDHVGIVNYVSGGRVHTVEGNAGNAVRIDGGRTGGYSLTDSQIIGYGVPNYSSDSSLQACVDSVIGGIGSVQVRGWAFDRSSLTQALDIRVYVGDPADSGAPVYTVRADKERKDVNAVFPGVGELHGFDETIYVSVSGSQSIYVYAGYAAQGVPDLLIGYWTADITADVKKPTIKNVKVSGISAEGYTVTCKVSDNVGIDRVMFPSWHDSGTGDQAVWFKGTVADGKAECFIPIEQLGNQSGSYTTHVYAYDRAGNYSLAEAEAVTIDIASLKFYKEQNLSTDFDALIESESSGKVLVVQEADIQACQKTESLDGQVWVFKREGTNSYYIQAKPDGGYLSVSSTDAGTKVMLSQEKAGQLWKACRAGDDSYYLKPEGSENCVLTPFAAEGTEQVSFVLDSFGAAEEQRFKIRKLSTNVKSIVLGQNEMNLTEVGQKETIQAVLEPQSAADEKICWQSSNEKVAVVNKNGQVTAVGNGTADITASTEDGSLQVICKVTVAVKVTGVNLSKQQIKLTGKGDVKKLSAAVMPDNAYNRTVTWDSSNKKVASVDQSGSVTAVAGGTAEITAQSAGGEQTAVCKVTVQIPQIGAGGTVKSGQYTYSADFIRDSSSCKTVVYRQKTGGSKTKLAQITGEAYLKLIYGGKLYYEKVVNSSKRNLCAMDTKTFVKQTVRSNAVLAGHYGKRFLVMPYSAKTKPQACYVLNVTDGKTVLISKTCMGAAITSSKVYYLEAVSGETAKGRGARVYSCNLSGAKAKCITGKITVGTCEKLTSKYVIYQSGKSRYQYKYAGKKKIKL